MSLLGMLWSLVQMKRED